MEVTCRQERPGGLALGTLTFERRKYADPNAAGIFARNPTVASISSRVAVPVDRMSGLPVLSNPYCPRVILYLRSANW